MSDILGVTERTIQNYETGSTRLTIENWVRCITILERHVHDAETSINKGSLPVKVSAIVENMLENSTQDV